MLWIFCPRYIFHCNSHLQRIQRYEYEFSHFFAAKYEACILLIALSFRPIVHTCYRIISILVQRICIRGMLLSHVTQCLVLLRYCIYFGAFTECSSKTKWQVCSYVSRKCCVCVELLHVLHVAAFNGCYANLAVSLPPGDCYGVL